MILWRLSDERYARTALSGEGSALQPGRWHRMGSRVVYAADSLALAVLEQLVHAGENLDRIPFVAFKLELPDDMRVTIVQAEILPDGWRMTPGLELLRAMGTLWMQSNESAVLVVPSAVVPEERNALLNPNHPDFDQIRVAEPQPFSFDPRLVRGVSQRSA